MKSHKFFIKFHSYFVWNFQYFLNKFCLLGQFLFIFLIFINKKPCDP